ncbi:ferritin family protein [Clostridium sp. ATCC 25772]|uniref:ferritin family protein n=1 Tax=Clostridium sp. ATCC 25772 TaxID=1676991 RepID=UPI0007834EAA|nr:ferritin family protein [Clostridium sp. ATCC 25772]
MSYTTKRQPQGKAKCYENILREVLIAELVAIEDYTNTLAYSDIKELNHIIEHILEEEKEHYGMILYLLRKVDREEYEMYKRVLKKDEFNEKPFKIQNGDNKKDKRTILNTIREDIKGEFEAVVLYEDLLDEIPDREGKNILHKIILDEKEHAEELTQVLLKIDKDKYGPISD